MQAIQYPKNPANEDHSGKFSQLWKVQRGFRIIRKNKRTTEIERQKATRSNTLNWVVIGHYKDKSEMEKAYVEMLLDDWTITGDCYATDFK